MSASNHRFTAAAESLRKMRRDKHLTLLLVRHGQAQDGVDGIDPRPLTAIGQQQAALLAERFARLPLDHLYASTMERSKQTAAAIHKHHPNIQLEACADFCELSAVRRDQSIDLNDPERQQVLRQERARARRLAEHLRSRHESGQWIAAVGHNGINGLLLAALAGLPDQIDYRWFVCHTAVSVLNVTWTDARLHIRMIGCTRHLPPELVTEMNGLAEQSSPSP